MELNKEVVRHVFHGSILTQLGQIGFHQEPVLLRRLVKNPDTDYCPDGHCNCMKYKWKGKVE